ncbi:MAG TPA: tetratricopeptide repeat protein [bacterium]|nr:tetratricopeptide repeat protein [bacterium]
MTIRIFHQPKTPRLRRLAAALICALLFASRFALCADTGLLEKEGDLWMKQERPNEALACYGRILDKSPKDAAINKKAARACMKIAEAHIAKSEYADAAFFLRKAAWHNPGDSAPGDALERVKKLDAAATGTHESAVEQLKQEYGKRPGDAAVAEKLCAAYRDWAVYSYRSGYAERALVIVNEWTAFAPKDASPLILAGSIHYQNGDFERAADCFSRARRIDPKAAAMLKGIQEKMGRERSIEQGSRSRASGHFTIFDPSGAGAIYTADVLAVLERARTAIMSSFDLRTDAPVPVIIYTGQQFDETTGQAGRAAGLYDGKIRINRSDVEQGRQRMENVLYHEYAHAALVHAVSPKIPRWFHEGFAQYNEPSQEKPETYAGRMADFLRKGTDLSRGIDSLFSGPPQLAYTAARLFFRQLVNSYGADGIRRLFAKLRKGTDWRTAVKQTFGKDQSELEGEFAKTFRRL